MAQYDLHLIQNTSGAGTEFSEKIVNIAKGGLLSADTSSAPTVLPAGTDGYFLKRNDGTATGLEWVALAGGHTQNTDTGTTANTFTVDSDSTTGKMIFDVALGAADLSLTLTNEALTSTNKTITFPNATGTVALTSDLHTQNADTGTTSTIFELDSDGYKIELTAESATKLGVKVDGGGDYANLQAKDATFAKVTVSAAPSAGSDLTNKTYVDNQITLTGMMRYMGTVGSGGTHEIAAFNSLSTYYTGYSYRVITAGTIRGHVCEIGDILTTTETRLGSGNQDSDWTVLQNNIDGAVIGPSSVTDGALVLFDQTSGKLIKAGSGAPGTMAYETATNYVPKSIATEQGSIFYASGVGTIAELLHGNAGQVLQSGGNGANPSWLTLGSMAAATATDYVAKALFDANTILAANTDNTPAALTVTEQTIVGRKTGGNIAALTGTEVMNVIWVAAPANKTSNGTAGSLAYDGNYFYICDATNTWIRSTMATNW